MDSRPVNSVELRIDHKLFEQIHSHLFPGDGDEHGGVLLTGIAESRNSCRLLVREFIPAIDGIDYVAGEYGYRALTPEFVARLSDRAQTEKLCYFALHCHPGKSTSVKFSDVDIDSQKRGYPALLEINEGRPVGAIVMTENAIAGNIWRVNGQHLISHTTIIGPQIREVYPSPPETSLDTDPIYDRNIRLIGEHGQAILSNLKIGIVGLGGAGSLLSEWLSKLGVGHIIGIDFDKVEATNLPRIVGATHRDAMKWLTSSRWKFVRRIGKLFSSYKVAVARRVARKGNPKIRYDTIVGDVCDQNVADLLTDADFIFLASDTMQSRLVCNAIFHQFLIPGMQVGAKVGKETETDEISNIFTASRPILPLAGGGCLKCNNLIISHRLQNEAEDGEERERQNYADPEKVPVPSVITLNALASAQAANDFLMMFTGLFHDATQLNHLMQFVQERSIESVESTNNPDCLFCGNHNKSRRARGDGSRLPCKMP
ncbi:MAG: ThiF family adenylyltransferase [Planctomycetaceae bacterium]|nr:ThiF family adenylyltransferase [Planctomycetaceae bacterium]